MSETDSIQQFIDMVRPVFETVDEDGRSDVTLPQVIEDAYEKFFSDGNLEKSYILKELCERDPQLFGVTVNHLFTPINWSRVKLRTLFGFRNESTGNLVTLGAGETDEESEEAQFHLRDAGDLEYAPMLTGSEEDAQRFLKMLQEPTGDENPLAIGDTLVDLQTDDDVNVQNFELVTVKLIF